MGKFLALTTDSLLFAYPLDHGKGRTRIVVDRCGMPLHRRGRTQSRSVHESQTEKRLAVLIDADNASPSILPGLLAEVAKYGVAIVKRIYGDWTTPHLNSWKKDLLEHSIQPVQQFRYTVGKNATDSAMIIDAMDLLYRAKLEGFCLVSSDSDFTRLASRIREEGLLVYGFGERKTPRAFVTACDKFIFADILSGPDEPVAQPVRKTPVELKSDTRLVNLLRQSVDSCADEAGWANLSEVGNQITSQQPDFDSRNYGFSKLGNLFDATELFDLKRKPIGQQGQVSVFVRDARSNKG